MKTKPISIDEYCVGNSHGENMPLTHRILGRTYAPIGMFGAFNEVINRRNIGKPNVWKKNDTGKTDISKRI